MAIRFFFKSAKPARPKAEPAPDLQVDYSYTQWRYAQMLQLERNYLSACEAVDGVAAA